MTPYVGSLPGHVVGWITGTLLACLCAAWLLRRDGVSWGRSGLALVSLPASVYCVAKLICFLDALGRGLAPADAAHLALGPASFGTPGWLLLTAVVGVPLARLFGWRFLHAADVVSPAGGLLILGGRIGCFLEGCCFGTPSTLPWALRFPIASPAYRWQLESNLIWLGSPVLPVHPLQLYFAGLGLLIVAVLNAYRCRKRYDGEMLLLFGLMYLWGTWLLEHLRAQPNETAQLVLVAALAVSALTLAMEARRQVWRRVGKPLTSEPLVRDEELGW